MNSVFHASIIMLVLCIASHAHADIGTLDLAAPIDRWDEAVPLGNGLMGGLLWGNANTIKLSLDRGDLWDLRVPDTLERPNWTYATIRSLVRSNNQAKMVEMFDDPYTKVPYPTKIPAGRIAFTLEDGQTVSAFHLDLQKAVGTAKVGEKTLEVFYSATEPIAMARFNGKAQAVIQSPDSLGKLGATTSQKSKDGVQCMICEAALGFKFAVSLGSRQVGDTTEFAIAITSTKDGADPETIGRKRVKAALDAGYDKTIEPHLNWWDHFWAQSSVQVPDPAIQRHYQEVQYFYGAASRRFAPPMPLQGVWTADEGALPPWHGDYHNDLNTQMTYWAYLESGHFDEGASFLEFMFNLLPAYRAFAKEFYRASSGAAVPGVMTLDGKPMGGWAQYSLSPTQGAWIAQAYYLHWRYTMDEGFLKKTAYPYCEAIADCLIGLMKPGKDGKLKLPLSTSPEIHDNSMKAWLTPNSNYDLALMRWLFGALQEMAITLGNSTGAEKWGSALARMDDLAVEGTDGCLRISPDESLTESHRHFSHLMAIYPLGTLNIEGTDRDRHIIKASLQQLDKLGTSAWCGFSFSWRACMAARVGDSKTALDYLKTFVSQYISRNGFHINWPLSRGGGHPFTLEANFAAAQAVHEMLLQSWGGIIRIFPAVPAEWADASFQDLRAEGAYTVSAKRENGKTTSFKITATRNGVVRVKDTFNGAAIKWNLPDVTRASNVYECKLTAAQSLEGRLGLE